MSAYVKCADCGEIIEIPPELSEGYPDGDITYLLSEIYLCDACEEEFPEFQGDPDLDEYDAELEEVYGLGPAASIDEPSKEES